MANILNPKSGGADLNENAIEELVDTGAGTVARGWVTGSFLNSGAADITVNGKTLEPGASKTYPNNMNRAYPELAWDATGSTVTILIIY